ncbi:hypothetical protein J6590_026311 [Homalodisca vitripennis]|nr:hypothetical protein J6590_026311 [Homalodisca vitripennis]
MGFDGHLDNICNEANKMLGFISRFSKGLNRPTLLHYLYCCLVRQLVEPALCGPLIGAKTDPRCTNTIPPDNRGRGHAGGNRGRASAANEFLVSSLLLLAMIMTRHSFVCLLFRVQPLRLPTAVSDNDLQ